MSQITRNDIFARDENGPEWFQEFLRSMADHSPNTVEDILGAINQKAHSSVESIVQDYREQVGLDVLSNEDVETVKVASVTYNRPLSIRQASEQSVIELIQSDPELMALIEGAAKHSGGHKSRHAIICSLVDKLGSSLVKHTDTNLHNLIDDMLNQYKGPPSQDVDTGEAGLDSKHEIYDDDLADYALNTGSQ